MHLELISICSTISFCSILHDVRLTTRLINPFPTIQNSPLNASSSSEDPAYGLTIAVLARTPFVPISAEEFGAASKARTVISGALGIEETFNLVVGNYLEYELELLGGALRSLLYTEGAWSEFMGRIHEVNRRLMNLLAAGRAYLDQAPHYLSATFGPESNEVRGFRSATNAEYDARLGYRAMEALRNFALHRGLAVHRCLTRIGPKVKSSTAYAATR